MDERSARKVSGRSARSIGGRSAAGAQKALFVGWNLLSLAEVGGELEAEHAPAVVADEEERLLRVERHVRQLRLAHHLNR